jgi:hypothetical protein
MRLLPLLLLIAGCGLDPLAGLADDSGTASGDGSTEVPGVTVDPASVDFGAVELGDTSSVDLVVSNDAPDGIIIQDGAISGDSAGFVVESVFGFPITVQSGSEALLTVSFTPDTDLDYEAVLNLAIGDSLVEVPLSGVGGAGGADGTDGADGGDGGGDGGTPDGLAASDATLEFPDTYTNDTATRSVTLTNHGIDDALVTGLSFSDASSWSWAASAGESFTLAQVISSGNSKTLDITFDPSDIRAYSDTLSVEIDGQPDVVVGLVGAGTEPPCEICDPDIVVDTGGTDPTIMGFTSVLGFPDSRSLIIYNQSDVDLVISDVSLTNDTQGGTFSMSGLGATTIGPRGSTSGTVTFNCPTICFDIENFITGENYLTITSNDPNESSYQVGLRSIPE